MCMQLYYILLLLLPTLKVYRNRLERYYYVVYSNYYYISNVRMDECRVSLLLLLFPVPSRPVRQ